MGRVTRENFKPKPGEWTHRDCVKHTALELVWNPVAYHETPERDRICRLCKRASNMYVEVPRGTKEQVLKSIDSIDNAKGVAGVAPEKPDWAK